MKKKLIEVALPLEAINKASAREKSIRHGHPSTLHLWWARRPLAAARAVIFAQMVDDPSAHPDRFPTEEAQEKERQRLFRLIEELVKWENTTNETVLAQRVFKKVLYEPGDAPSSGSWPRGAWLHSSGSHTHNPLRGGGTG
jgi:adenine-specific DNA methylase